jgi:signal transduction histidine kinase
MPLQIVRAEDAPEIVADMQDAVARSGWRGRQLPGLSRPSEVLTAVARGAGWAPTASSLLGWAPPGVVVRPLADGPLVHYDIHVVWRDGDPLADAFARLVFELRDVIQAPAEPRPRTPAADRRHGYRAVLAQRHAERARIARDLHDTLLQDLSGSQMELDALRRRLPPALAAERATLGRVVERLARAGRAGREVVHGLRAAHPSPRDLALALSSAAEELREASPREFRMRTDGTPRALRARVEEAAYRIGVEAITNAFRHASASLVSVSLDYSDDLFRLRVADDGSGIAPEILRAGGPPGHFGIAGMRERAAEAGAALHVSSDVGAGSAVELVVPGRAAFAVRRG